MTHSSSWKQRLTMQCGDRATFFQSSQSIRRALEIVQLFATASRSQCNVEKSWLISLTESNGFDHAGWTGEVVGKGKIFWHLGAPMGYYKSPKQAFEWEQERIQKKMDKERYVLPPFHSKIKVLNTFLIPYYNFYSPILCLSQRSWKTLLQPLKDFLWRNKLGEGKPWH